jgi:GrpB-like predicted nucleotidyltransferase (UPF0157 family)
VPGQETNPPGHNQHPIIVVDYDPAWPEQFARIAAQVRTAAGELIPEVHHVGSTSVPGLAAKPIIDLLGGVRALRDAEAAREALEQIGFVYTPQYEHEMPDRRYFTQMNAVHFHVVEIGHEFYERHLAFRDWLRTHPEDRDAYAALKRELAQQYRDQRAAYTDAKTEFIRAIEHKALAP